MRHRSSVLVGRDHEVRELDQALRATVGRRGSAIFLVGEAGIGKTRLAREATGLASELGLRILRGRGSGIGPIVPFRPLTEALLSLFHGSRPPETAELGPYASSLGRLVPDWHDDGDTENNERGDSLVVLGEAILRLLSVASRARGCLLVLDDLQDADSESLSIVEYLIDNLGREPIVFLGGVRSEPSAALELARAAAQRRTCVLRTLDRLDRPGLDQLAGSYLGVEPAEVPAEVTDLMARNSVGNPFLAEELLNHMLDSGLLVCGPDGWRVTGELAADVPATVSSSVKQVLDRAGQPGRTLVATAAVLGERFPLAVVQAVTGTDDYALLSHIHAGAVGQLIVADDREPDWYAFRHPLTARAALAYVTPKTRAEIAGKAADAIEAMYLGLPGEWCQLAATLRVTAGDFAAAGRLFAEAGHRALDNGAPDSAVTLLGRARDLLADHPDPAVRADALEGLLYALAETGKIEEAFRLADAFAAFAQLNRAIKLHLRLGWAAYLAGRFADGMAQVRTVRALLGADDLEDLAAVEALNANLLLEVPGEGHIAAAEECANRALRLAEQTSAPAVSCQALQVLGIAARDRDLDEARGYLQRALLIAEQNRMTLVRAHVLLRLGGHDVQSHADATNLDRAREQAGGAVTVACAADALWGMDLVMRGEFTAAHDQMDRCSAVAARLRLTDVIRYLLVTRATLAAHQGKREEMETALARFAQVISGEPAPERAVVFGLARAFCALLEEDVQLARAELAAASDHDTRNPSGFRLTGRYGLLPLLDAIAGTLPPGDCADLLAGAFGHMRWNRQFLLLANAVLLGRAGDREGAADAMNAAAEATAPYAMARHLGLRLVAEAAAADGWGEPVAWLRQAEEYFHQLGVTAVASSCRALLRRNGVPVRQRRAGTSRLPDQLRRLGVTVREFEVLELLVQRLGNKAIGQRLHISPRTVEKHVASLATKTNQPDRVSLGEYAVTILRRADPTEPL
ncbi:helix-turn-helix transcriptional regulator [Amycolatopsis pigmentata]|uniref:AAA family ATPase n=1 Tax=Amycolatopsis pigmentata TaxID=450801 RepID=A0ABW5G6M0_9PSEU